MQLNMALFEFNGRTGYLLKHDFLRRADKKFDPHTERFDTIIASTLTIQIYSGQFLSDKNVKTGVEVEIIGLPKDPKRKFRTKWSTTPNAINPLWNEEPFVFEKILLPELAYLRIVVHEESGKFLGHRIIPIDAIQPDFTDALFNPTKTEKPVKYHEEYVSPFELPPVIPVVTDPEPITQEEAGADSPPQTEDAVTDSPSTSEESAPAATEDNVPSPETQPAGEAEPITDNGNTDLTPESAAAEPASNPAPDAEAPADDAPAQDGDAPADNAPAQDGDTPAADAPAQDGDTPAADAPAQDGDTPAADAPAQDGDTPAADAPAQDGDAPPDDAPAQDGDAPAADAPAQDGDTPAADAPAEDGDVPPDDAPAQDGEAPADDAPAKDENTPVDVAVIPSLNTDPSSDPAEPQVTEEPSKDTGPEPESVTLDELKQHKTFLKVTKKHEKEIGEMEKKFQKKADDLISKYKESFKSAKKKTSGKKKDGEGGTTPVPDKAVELKAKLKTELKTLWEGQYDLLKVKKEQHATEELTKLLELAAEKHAKETQAMERAKKDKNGGTADDSGQSTNGEALGKKQAATLQQIKDRTNQLNHETLSEHEKKTRSLPVSVKDAVNGCVSPHFPELVDQSGPGTEGGNVFRG
ncbi:hypothetical protein SKAU_G00337160 [Synaphobranchus kaupii]|uniref:C2 domain-containing protein n=1 Tax=Synaphobranchus kaupii TaxID=118154 RepID=A0A9Q1EMG9_SYNKA|nr:hypothetical protein SKAU_G00337160 [Synaphobranchus kaupii]